MNNDTLIDMESVTNRSKLLTLPPRLLFSYLLVLGIGTFLILASFNLSLNTNDSVIYFLSGGLILAFLFYSATVKQNQYEKLQYEAWKVNYLKPYLLRLNPYTTNGILGKDYILLDVVGNLGKLAVIEDGLPVEKECFILYNASLTEPVITYRLLEESVVFDKVSRFEEPQDKYFVVQVPLNYYRKKDQLY